MEPDHGPGRFAAASAVTPTGDGTFAGTVQPGWDIGGHANGGYLLTIATRALLAATGRPDPVSVSGYFLSPGQAGPVTVATRVVKQGRRFTTASALLEAEGRPVLSVLGTFGDLGATAAGDSLLVDGGPPDLPPPDECVLIHATDTFPPPFMGQVELRIHPDDLGFATGPRRGPARIRGWFQLRDGEPTDTVALLCALDAFPPAVFNADVPTGWVPTVELTAHVRARPAPGPVRCVFTTRYVTAGFLEEDAEIWDGEGTLVAQSRQLALVPRA